MNAVIICRKNAGFFLFFSFFLHIKRGAFSVFSFKKPMYSSYWFRVNAKKTTQKHNNVDYPGRGGGDRYKQLAIN